MSSATSSTRSVIITRSLCPRISLACCASCTLMPPSSPSWSCLDKSITTARHGLKGQSSSSSGSQEIQLLDFLYGEWGVTTVSLLNSPTWHFWFSAKAGRAYARLACFGVSSVTEWLYDYVQGHQDYA